MRSGVILGASIALATFAAAEPSLRHSGVSSARTLNASDRAFAAAAASSTSATVETSKLAMLLATTPVQALAQQVRQDAEKRQAELGAVVADLPDPPQAGPALTPERQQMHHRLAALEGPAFDQAYMQQVLDDERRQLARFERHAREGSDAGLKSFAEKTLPTLHAHLRLTQARAKRLGSDGAIPEP